MAYFIPYVLIITLFGTHNKYSSFRYNEESAQSCNADGEALFKIMSKSFKHFTIACERKWAMDVSL